MDENTLAIPNKQEAMDTERQEEHAPVLRVWLFEGGRLEWHVAPIYQEEPWKGRAAARAIFFLLLCAPNRQALRGHLTGILWPEMEEENARSCLRSALKVLRQVLRLPQGQDPLIEAVQNGEVLQLKGQEVIWVDADAFEALVQQASQESDPQHALPLWQQARVLLKGEVLAEDRLREWITHRWIKARRQRVQVARRRLIRSLADLYMQRGEHILAEELLQEHLINFPSDQDALYRLMKLLIKAECFVEAREAYERGKAALTSLGKHPAEPLKALAEQLITPKQLSFPSLPTPVLHDETPFHFTQAIKQGITEAIRELEETTHLEISRRHLLQQTFPFLLGISDPLLSASVKEITASLADEVLSFYMAALPACWSLVYNGGMKYVEKVLPSYLAHLVTFMQQSPEHRIMTAHLTSQGYQIASMLALENENYHAAFSQINSAIEYAKLTQDADLETAALIRKVTVLWYWRKFQQMHDVLQVATKNIHRVSPLIQANIYSELAADLITSDDQQMIFSNIKKARDVCPQNVEQDPVFPFTYITPYLIYFNENVACVNLKRYKDAWNALEMAEHYVSPVPSTRRIELLTHQVSVAVALGDLDRSYEKMKEAIVMNHVLASNLWLSTLENMYEVIQNKWSTEIKIKHLSEMIQHNT